MLWSAEQERPGGHERSTGRRDGADGSHRVLMAVLALTTLVTLTAAVAAIAGVWPFGSSPAGSAAAVRTPTAATARFDVHRALDVARMQVDAGPRPAGSRTLRRVAARLRRMLPDGRYERVPGHPGLRNIVGSVPGPGPVLVIAAHYDTQPFPRGFVGANDAAAAVGAVVELARAATRMKRPATAPGIRFVLFDGEESPSPDESDFYATALRGSRAYVSRHAEEVGALVLLDYVAHKGARFPREGTSDPALWSLVRESARRAGAAGMFPDRVGDQILDDHTPFRQAGIPAVDLIDWSYRYKNTIHDTWDKLSPASLDAVGETIAQLIVDLDRRAARGLAPGS